MKNVNLEEKKVTMSTKDYFRLQRDVIQLSYLEMFGVDNWGGYEEALSNNGYDGEIETLYEKLNLEEEC